MTIDTDWIAGYVDGTLDPSRRRLVEAALARDPTLAAAVRRERDMAALLSAAFPPVEEPLPPTLAGLLAPRPELATLLGQLGMSAALLLGVLPAARLPLVIQYVRDLLPSTYGVEAVAHTLAARPDWPAVGLDLGVCAAVGVVSLAVATWAYRRAAVR